MPEWEYLYTPPFRMRYMIAAQLVGHYPAVVEIGGNGVIEFLPGQRMFVICVDPRFPENWDVGPTQSAEFMTVRNKPFQECLGLIPESDFGLVCLGFEIKGELEPLFDIVNRSRRAVFEYPDDWEPSRKQFEQVLANTTKKVTMRCQLDLSGNDLGDIKGYPPRYVRNMYVLE